MEVLKFNLWGLGAKFTRPHINSIYSTYPHIHKVALLGMLGAIIGIEKSGVKKGDEPNFYRELKNLKVAIVPKKQKFSIVENMITETSYMFNKDKEGCPTSFITYNEDLFRPSWDIYILSDNSDKYKKIKEYIIEGKSHFIPCLGKNEFPGSIKEVEVLDCEEIDPSYIETIDGLFPKESVELGIYENIDVKRLYNHYFMPVALDDILHQYVEKCLVLTNNPIENIKNPENIKVCQDKTLYFL